jgi:cytochrome b subunit of formate dehydrogenase
MRAPIDKRFFKRWFELLARYKFGAALLPIAGISIGFFLTVSGYIVPQVFSWYVSFIGVAMMAVCAVLFLAVTILHVVLWVKGSP